MVSRRRERKIALRSIFAFTLALLVACSDIDESPEDEIRRLVERGVEAAESRSLGDIEALLHAGYLDQKGYDKSRLSNLLRAYFLRHRNIHLFSKIDEIRLLGDNRAEVRLHLAMAGSLISDVNAIPALRAQLYRLELDLLRQEDWQVQHARWGPANLTDLQ